MSKLTWRKSGDIKRHWTVLFHLEKSSNCQNRKPSEMYDKIFDIIFNRMRLIYEDEYLLEISPHLFSLEIYQLAIDNFILQIKDCFYPCLNSKGEKLFHLAMTEFFSKSLYWPSLMPMTPKKPHWFIKSGIWRLKRKKSSWNRHKVQEFARININPTFLHFQSHSEGNWGYILKDVNPENNLDMTRKLWE